MTRTRGSGEPLGGKCRTVPTHEMHKDEHDPALVGPFGEPS